MIPPPAGRTASPVPVTTLEVERYAAFRADVLAAPTDADRDAVRARFGLDAAGEAAETRAWNARFREDRFAFADYMQVFTQLRPRKRRRVPPVPPPNPS